MSDPKPFENFARAVKERWPDEPDPVEDNLERADNANSPEHALVFLQTATVHQLRKLTAAVEASHEDLIAVADTTPDRPDVVVLCGSTRFYDEFQEANYNLTMQGKIVLSVGFYPHAKARHGHGEGVGHDSAEKVALDELHKRKIDLADRVLVLNVGGYIGESTRGEIAYAQHIGRPIQYLESAVS